MTEPDRERNPAITYRDAGVDIDAGNRLVELIKPLARSTRRPGADTDLGGFGGLFDLKGAGFRDPVLVSATDGVGTKLKIAIDTGQHATIGIDLVAMCVNDLVVQGAEPLFFLDYFACGKLDVEVTRAVVAGIADGCRQAGCALIGGETAEMPGMYQPGDYDLAGFAVGAVERGQILPRGDIVVGDKLIGLAVLGRAFQRLFARPPPGEGERSRLGGAGAVRAKRVAGRSAARPDAHLRQTGAGRDRGRRRHRRRREGAGAHHRRRSFRERAARADGDGGGAHRSVLVRSRPPCSAGWRRRDGCPMPRC